MKFLTRILTAAILICAISASSVSASESETYTDGNNVITVFPNDSFVMISDNAGAEGSIITVKGYFDNEGNACITGFFNGDTEITADFSDEQFENEEKIAEQLIAENGQTADGWKLYQSSDINAASSDILPTDAGAAFSRAAEEIHDISLSPVAYLGSQIVSGTNYQILCIGTPEAENTVPQLYSVTVYENTDGDSMITQITDFNLDLLETSSETKASGQLDGGWTAAQAPETILIPEDARQIFDTTIKNPNGAEYSISALLATKSSDGTEYAFLCYTVPEDKERAPYDSLVFIIKGSDGSTRIKNIVPLDLADFSLTDITAHV